MKKALILIICFLVGAVLFYHAFRNFDLAAAWETAMALSWYALPLFFLLTLLGFVLSAWRWKLFVPERISGWVGSFTVHTIAGFMMSYITPATLLSGEPVKIYLLREHDGVGLRAASTSVVLDKFVELISVAVFVATAAVMAFSKGFLAADEKVILAVIVPVFVLCVAVVYRTYACSKPIIGWALRKACGTTLPVWAQRLAELEIEVMAYFSHHRKKLFQSFVIGLAVWAVKLIEIAVFLACLGVQPTIVQSFIIAFIPMLTWLLPIPAGLGAMESSILALFYFFGWDMGVAGAYIIITRLRDVCFVVAGFLHTFRHGLQSTFKAIFNKRKTEQTRSL